MILKPSSWDERSGIRLCEPEGGEVRGHAPCVFAAAAIRSA
jgi:hypothetical protein